MEKESKSKKVNDGEWSSGNVKVLGSYAGYLLATFLCFLFGAVLGIVTFFFSGSLFLSILVFILLWILPLSIVLSKMRTGKELKQSKGYSLSSTDDTATEKYSLENIKRGRGM